MDTRKHSRRAVVRRGIVMAVEAVIVTAVMLGAMALIGWIATMANAWVATL